MMGLVGRQAIVIGRAQAAGRAVLRALLEAGAEVHGDLPDATTPVDSAAAEATSIATLAESAGRFDLAVLTLDGMQGDVAAISAAVRETAVHLLPAMASRGGGTLVMALTLPAAPDTFHEAAAGWLSTATASLAARHAGDKLRINAVVALVSDTPVLPRFMAAAAAATPPPVPLATLPDPRAIAAAVLALCGSDATAITGQVLRIDGGRGSVTP